jgi:hypothetical protein
MLLTVTSSFSQSQNSSDLYYVVIGAFANAKNAAIFIENAKKKSLNAQSSVVMTDRKLHYVHILETPDKEKAISLAVKLQGESSYADTWVYSSLVSDPTEVQVEQTEVQQEPKKDSITVQPAIEQPVQEQEPIVAADGSKSFIFRIRSNDTGEEISGDVDIFDADLLKGRKIVSYKGNEVVSVKPVSKSGNMVVVCDLFGYRKI